MDEHIPGMTPLDVQRVAARTLRETADQIERGEIDIRAMRFDQHPPDAAEGEYTWMLRCGPSRPLAEQGITVAVTTEKPEGAV